MDCIIWKCWCPVLCKHQGFQIRYIATWQLCTFYEWSVMLMLFNLINRQCLAVWPIYRHMQPVIVGTNAHGVYSNKHVHLCKIAHETSMYLIVGFYQCKSYLILLIECFPFIFLFYPLAHVISRWSNETRLFCLDCGVEFPVSKWCYQ